MWVQNNWYWGYPKSCCLNVGLRCLVSMGEKVTSLTRLEESEWKNTQRGESLRGEGEEGIGVVTEKGQ